MARSRSHGLDGLLGHVVVFDTHRCSWSSPAFQALTVFYLALFRGEAFGTREITLRDRVRG
jgi:hypothetical protein